jgi:hypothetical protein
MSLAKNSSVRCDWCGRLSRNALGEYVRPDGSAGYIGCPDWAKEDAAGDDGRDICTDCEMDPPGIGVELDELRG